MLGRSGVLSYHAGAHSKHSTATEHAGAKRRKIETRSTATEHAARNSPSSSAQRIHTEHGTATEHTRPSRAPTLEPSRAPTLECNAETQWYRKEAQEDRANEDMVHLTLQLAQFLVDVMRELYCSPRAQYDCEDIVCDKITDWASASDSSQVARYGEDELELHKKMWDVMTREKDGKPKEHQYDVWCRRIAVAKETAIRSAATEHADDKSAYYNFARDVFAHELTPEQEDNPKYKLREGKSITTQQRGLINVLLRKSVGDARVAFYIFEHGVPVFLDPPRFGTPPTTALLQSMLDDFMTWHASLLHWLLEQQSHPFTSTAQKLSALDQREFNIHRRRLKAEARQQLREGEHLVALRDKGKRNFEDMSATEQQTLEHFEHGKLKKRLDQLRIQKPDRFGKTIH